MSTIYNEASEQLYTILDFLRWGSSQFLRENIYHGHGYDNAWDEALALLSHALGLDESIDASLLPARLTMTEKERVLALYRQRIEEKVPVPYLTEKAYFCGLPFIIDERVLIPRSPIAELIEQRFSPWVDSSAVSDILDLCTGSACIAIACAYAFPEASVDAVDISPEALEVAQKNVALHECQEQVSLLKSDVFDGVSTRKYDIIVSNPPYVSQQEIDSLPEEYAHEPELALLAEQQGLAIVDKILAQAAAHLNDNGLLVVEVGNSDLPLIEKYPEVPFVWLEFERGGSGVFALSKEQIEQHFK